MKRTRRRILIVWKGLATLTAIYRRDRDLRQTVGTAWRISTREGLIGVRNWLIQAAPPSLPPAEAEPQPEPPPPDTRRLYTEWLAQFDPLHGPELQAAQRHLTTLRLPDLLILAVITPADLPSLGPVIASWQTSLHPAWHAAIVAPAALSAEQAATLQALATPRITILRTPDQIEAARARAGYTLLCFGSTRLNSLSAYMLLEAALRTGADIVYSDHDQFDAQGHRTAPAFKPQFSPEYLARYNYIGDCLLLSPAIRFPPGAAAALPHLTLLDYDRLVAQLVQHRRVEHLPFTLFHVQGDPPRLPHDPPEITDTGPSVALIIPIRDGLALLRACIDSIRAKTSYDLARTEIIIVDNDSIEPETHEYLQDLAAPPNGTPPNAPNVTVVKYPGGFNFAEINNTGARATTSDILVFLNNDTVVHDPAWLSKLVYYTKQPGIGMVGGKLLFPDGTIQHGGCVAGASRGTVQHLLSFANPEDVAASDHTREMSVLTGACLAVRRDVFQRIGGFDPILQVTWNDVKACLQGLSAGLRNIYIADPLLIHDESKTRGHDDTRERYIRYFSEADYTRRQFRQYFQDDPSYNPNLSLVNASELAAPPRIRRPWSRPPGQPLRILLLSVVYRVGFGVPLVIQQHAQKLTERGYHVIIGGPAGENELSFPGCERVTLGSVTEAATYAFRHDVALIVSHTPPFFEIPLLIGPHIPVLAYDYGEPGADFFPEPTRSYLQDVADQKRRAAALTTTLATISQAVKDETLNKDAIVLGLANSHLPAWSEALRPNRDRVRREHAWTDHVVVLTVCRFHENERAYKGLDKIAAILREFPYLYPESAKPLIWVLAGAGTPRDVELAQQLGFTVFPNVSDATLADLYQAADAYMGFSKWEGYNLGISQALAMGLPTLGSDIPVHREFPITTTHSTLAACNWLANEIALHTAATPNRRATVYQWERSTTAFLQVVEDMLHRAAPQPPRPGASGAVWTDPSASARHDPCASVSIRHDASSSIRHDVTT